MAGQSELNILWDSYQNRKNPNQLTSTVTPEGILGYNGVTARKVGQAGLYNILSSTFTTINNTLTLLDSRISVVEGIGRIVARVGDNPTDTQLSNTWIAKLGTAPNLGATIINLDQDYPRGHAWTFLGVQETGRTWIDRGTDVFNIATTGVVGAVLATNPTPANNKYIAVDGSTGSMWLIG